MIGEKDGLDRFLSSRSRRRRNSFFFLAHKQFDHGSVPARSADRPRPFSIREQPDRFFRFSFLLFNLPEIKKETRVFLPG
jgi:hypothetical protein